jgi:hypothetical protein
MVAVPVYGDEDTGALLARLSRAWEAKHPRKASGGAHALSGFSFQFSLALLEVLERWKGLAGDRRAVPSVFVELLSDVVKASLGGSLVVAQVKRTQSPAAIRAGLEDLQSVYEVAAAEIPKQLSRLELELAFRTGRPEDAWPVIDAWVEEDPDARGPVAEAVSVNLYPDPENRIYALLVNKLNAAEPVALFHRWLGGLMSATGQPAPEDRRAGLEASAKEIWASLVELEKGGELRGGAYLWSPVDRPPDQVRSGGVLSGEQPTVAHLRKGFLADRPDALGRVRTRFKRWLAARSKAEVQTTVPMFWIGGRSGSGKSALLLQLLSSLQEEGTGPVLWLSNKNERLAETARWAREAFESERAPVLGIDDPYAPDGPRDLVWGSFLAELTPGLEAGEGEGVPILVCAGPSEQAEAFARDFSSDFDIEVVELEREQPEELTRLRDWYEKRTGAEAPGPDDENVLLVQLFFEWKAGVRLDAFAQRFRHRLQEADRETEGESLVTVLADVLALNRIYVGYPSDDMRGRLTAPQADILRRLQEEEHIAIDEEPGRSGVWMAHPHLANEIYEVWFPRQATGNQRRDHFFDASRACLTSGKRTAEMMAPIRAMAQALEADSHVLRDRIDPEFVAALPELYASAKESDAEMPIDQLSLWMEVQRVAGVSFDPDPVEDVLPRIEPGLCDDPSAARFFETLISSFDRWTEARREQLSAAIMDLLARMPDWSGWPRVAISAARAQAMPGLPDLLDEWLEHRLARYPSGRVLQAALAEYPDDPRFEAHAFRLLRGRPGHPAWGRTWFALWDRQPSEDLIEIGIEWLGTNRSDRAWTFVWRSLFRDPPDEKAKERVAEIGLNWLEGSEDHAGWSVVWEALWKTEFSSHLEQLALSWLEGADVNREGFGIVWGCMWDSGYRPPEFRQMGEAALRRMSTSLRAWVQMLSRLLREGPSDELWRVGMNWAETTGSDDRAWGVMLPALLDGASEREDANGFKALQEIGRGFLREADPSNPGWARVFCAIWDGEDEELRVWAREWIEDLGGMRPGWTFAWGRLWEVNPDEWLANLALLWLRENMGEKRWNHIWILLCKEDPEAYRSFNLEELLDLAELWLDATPAGERGWSYVFRLLWERRSSETARRLGLEWLAATKSGYEPAWDRVWALLWENPGQSAEKERAVLRRLGIEWLVCSEGHEHWPTVWIHLWDDRPDNRLRQLGDGWTRQEGIGNPGRRVMIARMVGAGWEVAEAEKKRKEKKEVARRSGAAASRVNLNLLSRRILKTRSQEAIDQGFDWVRSGPASGKTKDQIAWKRVWEALWKLQPSIELREIAIEWLETPTPTDARGRSDVWKILWRAEPTPDLYAIGCDYLDSAPFSRSKWGAIWQELWRYEESSLLLRLAAGWLDARLEQGEAQSPWPGIWHRAFEADPTPEMAVLGRRWLRAYADHPAAPHVRERLLEFPASDEFEAPAPQA